MESITKAAVKNQTIEEMAKRAFGPDTSIIELNEITDGCFNAAYSIKINKNNMRTILKISPDHSCEILTYEHDIMRREVETINWLKSKTDIPVPEIYYSDFSNEFGPHYYFFMQQFNGTTLNKLYEEMPSGHQEKISYEYGSILSKINSIPGEKFGPMHGEKSDSWKTTFTSMLNNLIEDAKRFKVELPFENYQLPKEIIEAYDTLDDVTQPCFLHWDSWEGNFVIDYKDDTPYIEGVIDWERSFYGDPLMESPYVFERNQHFIAGYGKNLMDHKSAKTRRTLYNIYLFLAMLIESTPRQYTDKSYAERSINGLNENLELIKTIT